jgi:hypothetical protein
VADDDGADEDATDDVATGDDATDEDGADVGAAEEVARSDDAAGEDTDRPAPDAVMSVGDEGAAPVVVVVQPATSSKHPIVSPARRAIPQCAAH